MNMKETDKTNQLKVNLEDFENENGLYGIAREDFLKQPFKNPETAYKEALNLLSQDDWEKKCHAMNIIRRLSIFHQDLIINNIHSIVLVLLQEVEKIIVSNIT
jgi:hypothetical protein